MGKLLKPIVDEDGDEPEKTGSGEPAGDPPILSDYLQAGTDTPAPEKVVTEPAPEEVAKATEVVAVVVSEIDKTRDALFAATARLEQLEKERDAAVKVLEKRNPERERLASVRAIQAQTQAASLAARDKQLEIEAKLGRDAPKAYPSKLDAAFANRPRDAAGQAAFYRARDAERQAARAHS